MRWRRVPVLGDQAGMALVIVLWMLSLLSIAALSLSVSGRTESRISINTVQNAKARVLADAAIHRGIAELQSPPSPERWSTDGVAHSMSFDGADLTVSLTDEAGKVDLNAAPVHAIRNVFLAAGTMPGVDAGVLADRVLDWRDPDDLRHASGAEEVEYRAARHPFPIRNGPFESVQDLQTVLGVTPDLYRQVEAAFTVHSGRAAINPAVAPRLVLLSLPGMDAAAVDSLIESRTGTAGVIFPTSAGADVTNDRGPVYTVRAEVAPTNGSRVVREAIVWIPETPTGRTYWILDWRDGRAVEPEESSQDTPN